ncbi:MULTISPECIES: hypothetical protein [Leptolyngbya]|jgi:hypothetical protein|uniref:Uncharacterized protein n=1 Tax=Leptolyngbya boryana NIES-2135 TaxID=1973484 RepID=A0A1Z4JC00_LEPBY|nr:MULTISPECIES: hypothetical protein [Leptolyngbya]BAY54304.1 hypothetical protein NIES2135_11210 [Leptolyngbya boryana NIES-2135]MBD1858803.1 hypothetical protein [Leptolyngbya sp. FACHB-1624]MBD2370828.1 hypothetical protein [Leptolyngbya sp. FACHB-161]MBD2377174.1 hypothetical protein [Leptolyngbya sp. FACHB-238]MBD2401616.1 hypothetical protein [Leptolyngbya sp. FACHB-239]
MRKRLLLLILGFALLLTQRASAYTPAQPYSLWFYFDRAPEAVQFVECKSTSSLLCDQPKLLIQYGNCTDVVCLKTQPVLRSPYKFECAETACLYQEPLQSQGSRDPIFQLIVQFSNQARSTPPFTADFRSRIAGYRDRHFTVIRQNQSLQVEPDEAMKPTRWEVFGIALTITQCSEFAIALLCLGVLRFNRSQVARVLLWIGFVNLLTFPVVWFFFPSLQAFQYRSTRVFGVFSLFNAIGFSLALVHQKTITTKTIIRTGIVWFFCLPIVLIAAFLFAVLVGYAEFLPTALGVPSLITLMTSQICVAIWEGWLLARSQSGLSNYHSYWLSLLINLCSFLSGLALLPTLQQVG